MISLQKQQILKDYQYGNLTFPELQNRLERLGENVKTESAPAEWYFCDDQKGWIRANFLAETLRGKGYEVSVELVEETVDGTLRHQVQVKVDMEDVVSVRGLKAWGLTASDGSVLLARKDLLSGFWEAFNAAALDYAGITKDRMEELANRGTCVECGSRHARRWIYLVRTPTGNYVTYGTNCGAAVFGFDMSRLWAQQKKAVKKLNAIHFLYGEFLTISLNQNSAIAEFEDATGLSHERAVEVFTQLTSDAKLSDTYFANTLKMLTTDVGRCTVYDQYEDKMALTRWGFSVKKTVESFLKKTEAVEKAPEAPKPTAPSVAAGERGEFVGRVTKIEWRNNPYSYYSDDRCITVTMENGWRLWFKSARDEFESGNVVKFSASVSEHKESISFLKRVTKPTVIEEGE